MAAHIITGGAGFIGVNLARRLLARGHTVIAVDDLSRGRREFLDRFADEPRFSFLEVDCSDAAAFAAAIRGAAGGETLTDVWHMAANSDIPAGVADPRIDHERTFLTTFATLLVMRELAIGTLHFASSSAVYGDLAGAISELSGPPEPISNYGAMKLASEAQIRAAVESYLPRADIFRFPNVIGVPATHGVLIDLIRKAKATPDGFDVLGDGTQRKAYLHVEDLLDAMLLIGDRADGRFNVFNIGPLDDGITVREIAEAIRDAVAPEAVIRYGKGNRGWVGDVPAFYYDTGKIARLGWAPTAGSAAAIRRAIAEIAAQEAAR